jgi:hypothetical protein
VAVLQVVEGEVTGAYAAFDDVGVFVTFLILMAVQAAMMV